jgi:hypothetical protein
MRSLSVRMPRRVNLGEIAGVPYVRAGHKKSLVCYHSVAARPLQPAASAYSIIIFFLFFFLTRYLPLSLLYLVLDFLSVGSITLVLDKLYPHELCLALPRVASKSIFNPVTSSRGQRNPFSFFLVSQSFRE